MRKKREKRRTLIGSFLKKRCQISEMCRYIHVVLRFLMNFWHRPAIRFGLARDPRSRFRDSRFASFLAESNRQSHASDLQDIILRSRKFVRAGLLLLLVAGVAWVLVESARAISTF